MITLVWFASTAFADPAPPEVTPPIGTTIVEGATNVPFDAVPMFVYPQNGILPSVMVLDPGGVEIDVLSAGGGSSPAAEVEPFLVADTTYTLSDETTSITFTTGAAPSEPPADAPSMAGLTIELPSGETGSGWPFSVDVGPQDETVFFYVDGALERIKTPEMSSDFFILRGSETEPFCMHLRVRSASGVLSDPGEELCFGEQPTTEPPTGPSTEPPTGTSTQPPTGTPTPTTTTPTSEEPSGCSSLGAVATGWLWVPLAWLASRRRG